jgi:hypothetical protein
VASDYLENVVNDHVYGRTTFTAAATLYLALYTVAPNFETGSGGTEVSGNNYSRLAVTNNTTNFPNSSGGSKSNGVTLTFATPSGSWGTVVAWALWDAASGGNLYEGNTFTGGATFAIVNGDNVRFNAGTLTLTVN